jgi:hypothetical protein
MPEQNAPTIVRTVLEPYYIRPMRRFPKTKGQMVNDNDSCALPIIANYHE